MGTEIAKEPPLFDHLTALAKSGQRCPTNDQIDNLSGKLRDLARAGHIRVEVSDKNWRTVFILTGPHAGLFTKASPAAGKPYLISDKSGTWRSGETPRHQRTAPTMGFDSNGRRIK